MAQLSISEKASKQLSELSKKRKSEFAFVSTKKGITEVLIAAAHKKEISQ